MAAYLVADITVHDAERYETYRAGVPAIIAAHGGRYLVRAGASHAAEGSLGFDRFVIIEFPSLDAARRFYDSEDYAPFLKLRSEDATSKVAFVEGVTLA